MTNRFEPPGAGLPAAVRFPAMTKATLGSGLRVWSLPHQALPVTTMALVMPFGASHDPETAPGLAGVLGDLLDEGAGARGALELAEAFAAMGTELSVEVGPDVTTLSMTVLSRFFEPAIDLLFDVVAHPQLTDADFQRVVEIRLNRLRQLRSSASAIADRAFLQGVFGAHPYGHTTLGTVDAIENLRVTDVRAFHAARVHPRGATCIVAGDLDAGRVHDIVSAHAGRWPGGGVVTPADVARPLPMTAKVLIVDRPGSPQTEVRVGHLGPSRDVDGYHALVTLNAIVGGQFTSRINQNLREARGLTYGAHTAFDFRLRGGAFECDTAVQSDATPLVVREILGELAAIGAARPAEGEELERAKSSLTRGYVRHFETSAQLALGACRLAAFGLPDETFARFVPAVEAVTSADVTAAARQWLRPDEATVVVVGDAAGWRDDLASLGRPVDILEI